MHVSLVPVVCDVHCCVCGVFGMRPEDSFSLRGVDASAMHRLRSPLGKALHLSASRVRVTIAQPVGEAHGGTRRLISSLLY